MRKKTHLWISSYWIIILILLILFKPWDVVRKALFLFSLSKVRCLATAFFNCLIYAYSNRTIFIDNFKLINDFFFHASYISSLPFPHSNSAMSMEIFKLIKDFFSQTSLFIYDFLISNCAVFWFMAKYHRHIYFNLFCSKKY